jgi:hypothetical protein
MTPAIRVVIGSDTLTCNDDEVLVAMVCASGVPDGLRCPGVSATGLCARK